MKKNKNKKKKTNLTAICVNKIWRTKLEKHMMMAKYIVKIVLKTLKISKNPLCVKNAIKIY